MAFQPTPRQADKITVKSFFEQYQQQLKLSVVAGENGMHRSIRDKSINRPALALTGYFTNFASRRIQLFGAGEMAYLRDVDENKQMEIMWGIASKRIPCMIISRHLTPTKAMVEVAKVFKIPLLRSSLNTRDLLGTATILLEEFFAPRVTLHGTLLDVRGIGTLIRGESGVGKSECALALIERGHSLVADDVVHIKQMGERELMGSGPILNRGYMECRGLGIINVAELFGIRSVRIEKRVEFIITFQEWRQGMEEERTGLEREFYTILDIPVPHIKLPVRPGRDMARLVEVAAMIEALRQIGHDPAKDFNDRLIALMNDGVPPKTPLIPS
ncbi:MAG: HPr(Ser) kinase/phosphatase [Verrucomicrobiota bacterium]|nr:HPr(Ser) kinase/phosphatase [Verrucomicrobiota bacterium]